MKYLKHLVLLAAFFSLLTCPLYSQTAKSLLLSDLYSQYQKTKSVKAEQSFFRAFPETFKAFQAIYGYDDNKGPSPNYNIELQHIKLFFASNSHVNSDIFTSKLVNLCLNGKWNADAENYLQGDLRRYFLTHPKVTIAVLETKSKAQIQSFWFYYLDGPHFNEGIYKQTINLLTGNPKQKQSLTNAALLIKQQRE